MYEMRARSSLCKWGKRQANKQCKHFSLPLRTVTFIHLAVYSALFAFFCPLFK